MDNLIIQDKSVRTVDNLYSLNDLHKLSGGADKHTPFRFMRLSGTRELIAEIEKPETPDMVLSSSGASYRSIRGKNSGTYACKELVYAYAMWISAKFNLQVIRAFDKQQAAQRLDHLGQQHPHQLHLQKALPADHDYRRLLTFAEMHNCGWLLEITTLLQKLEQCAATGTDVNVPPSLLKRADQELRSLMAQCENSHRHLSDIQRISHKYH